MNLYDRRGYLNIPDILKCKQPFIFVVGGRGTGKTFGALREARRRYRATGARFMLLRRMQSQVDLINKPEYSPFKAVDRVDHQCTVSRSLSKYTAGFYDGQLDEHGTPQVTGDCIGYTCALSTISNMRGFDASDVDLIIFDEFIPEAHERPIKNEAAALFNAYETINRNRELDGAAPCQLLCLANANDLGNPVFLELGLVRKAESMRRKGQEVYIDPKRGICMIILQKSPISQEKTATALYRLAKDGEYSQMAIGNTFAGAGENRIQSIPLHQLVPVVTVGELTAYRIKGQKDYYFSTHPSGNPPHYGTGPSELRRFKVAYSWLWEAYMQRRVVFEERLCEILLLKYLT